MSHGGPSMANVIKIDLLKKYKFELGDTVYDVTEPTPEQSLCFDEKVTAVDGDSKKVYEETRNFLHELGIPKELGMGLSALQDILGHITPQKKS